MNKNLIVYCIVLMALFSTIHTEFICESTRYDSFLNNFGLKKPTNQQEYNQRLSIYCQNLKNIEEVNQKNLSYTLKQYKWMDKSDEELKSLIKVDVSTNNQLNIEGNLNQNIKKVGTVPASVDWRTSNDVSSIKDQGSCGCCWAFTTVGLYESWMMVKGENEYDLSEEYILQCTTPYTKDVLNANEESSCAGGIVDYSGLLMKRNGAPLETTYPYLGSSFGSSGTPTTPRICSANSTYLYARNPDATTFTVYRNQSAANMQQLISQGPVGALIFANAGFQAYSSGVYTGCPLTFTESYNNINHAVVIVGYDASGNYIIKNSWGTSWGDNGFGVVSASNDCGLHAFAYSYASSAAPGGGLEFTDTWKSSSWEQNVNKIIVLTVFLLISLWY